MDIWSKEYGDTSVLLVTRNGGKTFEEAKFIHLDSTSKETLIVDGVPYIKDGILKVKVYTINQNKEKTYYEFYSKDNGLTWEYYER